MARAAVHLRVLPATRGECRGGVRPCPLVSCRYHLLLDIAEDGRLFMTRDVDAEDVESIVEALREMPETCALDVAERGGVSARDVGEILGMHHKVIERTVRETAARLGVEYDEDDFDEREHPEDFYVRYSLMGADELAEVAAELRRRARQK